jgi:hypothetical protein
MEQFMSINLQKVISIVAASERYGAVAGIDGASANDIITKTLMQSRGSVAEAGRALLGLYNDFGADAVNAVLKSAPVLDPNMGKVVQAATEV